MAKAVFPEHKHGKLTNSPEGALRVPSSGSDTLS